MDSEGKHRAERPTLWQRITPELMYCFLFGALVRYLGTDLRIRRHVVLYGANVPNHTDRTDRSQKNTIHTHLPSSHSFWRRRSSAAGITPQL